MDEAAQRQLQARLVELERIRSGAEIIPHVIWVSTPGIRQMLYVSAGYESVWGRSRESLYQDSRSYLDAVHADDRRRLVDDLEARGKEGYWSIGYRIIRPNGEVRWIDDTGAAFRDESGEVVHIAGAWVDVTEAREAENRTLSQLRFVKTLIDTIPSPVFYKDREGVYLGCNQAFLDFFGATEDQVVGRTLSELNTEVPTAQYEKADAALFEGGGIQRFQAKVPRKDGELRDAVFNKATFSGADGETVGLIGVFTDISEHLGLEAQLRQSQKLEAVGQLAGGVAHDFNNILTGITGYASLLEDDSDQETVSECAREILRLSYRAGDLTRQLLAFSRRQRIEPIPLCINDSVELATKMLRRLIGEQIELRIHLAADLGIVEADPGQIEQILLNLAVNARDAMPSGGVLTIETSNAASSSGEASVVVLEVSDEGCGMDATTREHIFEPFFTTKQEGKGTGLGLATVYGIVTQHKSEIEVQSEPGRGTRFEIRFPSIPATKPKKKSSTQTQVPRFLGRGERLLLVEDEPAVRRLTERLLERLGYDVQSAANAVQARELLDAPGAEVELLLTDVVLPGESGRELFESLAGEYPRLRVLYMSGYSEDEVLHHGIKSGEFRFLPKPFAPKDLAEAVRAALDGS